jgi:transcriptional regulator with XRE-family HTH domain
MPYTANMTPTQLRKFLEAQGLTQIRLAMLLEIDPRTVRRYVNGESEIPTVIELACLGLVSLKREKRT